MINKYWAIVKTFNLRLLRQNLVNLFTYSYRTEVAFLHSKIHGLSNNLRNIRFELLYYKILEYYSKSPETIYEKELIYLKEIGYVTPFLYKQQKFLKNVIGKFDNEKGMPYVLHFNEKKIYFPKDWTVENAVAQYLNLVEKENILGGNYLEKSPHQYQSESCYVKNTDIVLDIGATEGLFALEIVDKAKKTYIFESDDMWTEPLKATFEPYKDKIEIINKYVSNRDFENETTLETCLKNDVIEGIFAKMDIEGDELKVIEGNQSFFSQTLDIRLSCATYHKKNDAEILKKALNKIGYSTTFSDGFIVFIWDENIQPPYFRHGIIRANKLIK